jgi:uncharacterized protein (TIRG00374 family)
MAKRIAFIILLILGLGGAIAIPFFIGEEGSKEALSKVGFWCTLIYVANSSLAYLIPAVSWWILLKAEKLPVTLVDCIRASLMGFPVSLVTPSMYLGGEPVKAIFIASHYKVSPSKVAATMTVSKFQESIGLLLFMLISVAGVILGGKVFEMHQTILICILMAFLVALIVAIMIAYGKGYKPLTRITGILRIFGLKPARIEIVKAGIASFEECTHRSIYTHWKAFLIAQVVCLGSAVSILVRPLLFIIFLPAFAERGFDPAFLFTVFVFTNLVNLVQITPGGLGTFDAMMVFCFGLTGYAESDALAFNIMNRIYDVVLFTIGTWLLAHYGLMRFLKPKAKSEPSETRTLEDPNSSRE